MRLVILILLFSNISLAGDVYDFSEASRNQQVENIPDNLQDNFDDLPKIIFRSKIIPGFIADGQPAPGKTLGMIVCQTNTFKNCAALDILDAEGNVLYSNVLRSYMNKALENMDFWSDLFATAHYRKIITDTKYWLAGFDDVESMFFDPIKEVRVNEAKYKKFSRNLIAESRQISLDDKPRRMQNCNNRLK